MAHSYATSSLDYEAFRASESVEVREERDPIREEWVQALWCHQHGLPKTMGTDQGQRLRVVSPGWWNRGEGPDFLGAQIQLNGRLRTGDVEIHLRHDDWQAHGHHDDPRYDEVLLHVVLDKEPAKEPVRTRAGRPIPALLLPVYLKGDVRTLAREIDASPPVAIPTFGRCGAWAEREGHDSLKELLELAGEWRLMFKARALQERVDRAGSNQAVYELLLEACGYSQYKREFRALATHVPYDRARQLAREDPHLLEAAYLQVAGLLPDTMDEDACGRHHWERLQELRQERLPGLRTVAMDWRRAGVRPTNFPERRISGVARLIARTAAQGLVDSLEAVWLDELSPRQRREAFERLFPRAFGFWSNHCTWGGKPLRSPNAPFGSGRVRAIIGNVFLPAALAMARAANDRPREEAVMALFARLPQEPGNRILRVMVTRLFGASKPPRLTFRLQQGMHQMFLDWCETNPSCRHCAVARRLERGTSARAAERVKPAALPDR